MFFAVRVNFSLARLGINPQHVRASYRQFIQSVGKQSGNSAQEIALYIASQIPASYRSDLNPAIVKKWVRQRKVNPRDPEMATSLILLGLEELLVY